MDAPEIRLRCLDLAMTQAKAENQHGNVDRVVEIGTKFYTYVIEGQEPAKEPPTEPTKVSGPSKQKADKSPEIFK